MSHLKIISATRKGAKRATGVRIRAKSKKNKIVVPFRECEFVIRFGYGIDDAGASLEWLEENKMLDRLGLPKSEVLGYLVDLDKMPLAERLVELKDVRDAVLQGWAEVEDRFQPPHSKY